jgi:hypothetical protein
LEVGDRVRYKEEGHIWTIVERRGPSSAVYYTIRREVLCGKPEILEKVDGISDEGETLVTNLQEALKSKRSPHHNTVARALIYLLRKADA